MSFDDRLAARVRKMLARVDDNVVEKKMFGGLCFMVRGTMCCGVLGDDLIVRVGRQQYEDALTTPHARVFDFTGRVSKGMVYVDPEGTRDGAALRRWIGRGLTFVESAKKK